jgi:hypothetical protein
MPDGQIEVSEVQAVTPHSAALYEAGKALLVDSIDVGREFCKSMIPIATGAIATYLALLGLAVGKDYRPSLPVGGLLLLPVISLLASACVFAWAYFPQTTDISLESIEGIAETRDGIIEYRLWYTAVGFGLFVLGVAAAIAGTVYGFTIDIPVPAATK